MIKNIVNLRKKLILFTYLMTVYTITAVGQSMPNVLFHERLTSHCRINKISCDSHRTAVEFVVDNVINDSTFSGYMSINPNAYIETEGVRYKMLTASGIELAPNKTYFTKPREVRSFTLFFEHIPANTKKISFVEEENSAWNINNIILLTNNELSCPSYTDAYASASLVKSICDSLIEKKDYNTVLSLSTPLSDCLENHKQIANNLYVTLLYYQAIANKNLGNMDKAQDIAFNLCNVYDSCDWRKDITYAWMYGLIGDVYRNNSNYEKAAKYTKISAEIKLANYKKYTEDYALSIGKLAQIYAQMSDYKTACKYEEENLIIKQKLLGPLNPTTLYVARNLCNYFFAINHFAEAKALSESYIKQIDKEDNILDYISFASILANSLDCLGEHHQADIISKEVCDVLVEHKLDKDFLSTRLLNVLNHLSDARQITIIKKIIRKTNDDYIKSSAAQNIAIKYFNKKKYKDAIKWQEYAISLMRSQEYFDKTKMCESLNNLALYYMVVDDSTKVINLLRESLSLTEEVFGKNSYEYLDACMRHYYAVLKWFKYDTSFQILSQVFEVYKALFVKDFPFLTYQEKETLWNERFTDFVEEYFFNYGVYTLYRPEYKALITEIAYNNILFTKCLLLNSDIVKMHTKQSDLDKKDNWSAIREQSEWETKNLAEKLLVTWKDVQCNLPDSSIAVEFISANNGEYLALVLDKHNAPKAVVLSNISEHFHIDSYRHNEALIRDSIWNPILSFVSSPVANVYFAADADLSCLPIENIELFNKGKFVNFYRVLSTKDIIGDMSDFPNIDKFDNTLLVGGLIYENETSDVTNHRKSDMANSKYQYLPGTEIEIDNIENSFKAKGFTPSVLKKNLGTKVNFCNKLSARPQLIHLATHSYYWSNKGTSLAMDHWSTMMQSGIIMAPDSIASEQQESCVQCERDNRILSSYEVYNLDLDSTELVVLSSCKSGQGNVTIDGVIGLQRAFKASGVHKLLVSMWEIDDNATQVFMSSFYENLLNGKSYHSSLKAAQHQLKRYEGGIYSTPEYWAGFTIIN